MIRIVIADDHTMMRRGLRHIIEMDTAVEIIGEAENGLVALEYAKQGGFDVLVLDLSMPGLSGCQLVRSIRVAAPSLPLLLLTMYEEEADVHNAMTAGANGLLAKENVGDYLIDAITQVAAGRAYPTVAAT